MSEETVLIQDRLAYKGLSSTEAESLLETIGYNSLPLPEPKKWFKRFLKIIGEPMMVLLLITAVVYSFVGDKLEALILFFSIIPIALIEFFQQKRTDEALNYLNQMMTDYCMVYRDERIVKMEVKEIVPGDLVYLTAGDKVAADGYLLNSPGLMVDESILTGESIAVVKHQLASPAGILNNENKLLKGTLVVQGEGYFVVQLTGQNTAYGKLGNLLQNIISEKTPLQKKIFDLVRLVAFAAIFISCVLGIILAVRNGLVNGLLGGLTMAISLIPEEFPIVFSVFLIMGVWRMTKQKSLIREMAMVEILGSATVICTDKTGTLTEGKMSLKQIYFNDKLFEAEQIVNHQKEFSDLIIASLLSMEQVAIDPMEIEVQRFAGLAGIKVNDFFKDYTFVEDNPFDAKNKVVSHLWKDKRGGFFQYTAGAPESIIRFSNLSERKKIEAEKAMEKMADKGYRVIAVAQKKLSDNEKISLRNLSFLGMLFMSDPPREGVKNAITVCQNAGIRIIMITGDNKLTAHNIAEQIGLRHSEQILAGSDIEKLSPDALKEAVKRHDIFVRVYPEQKYSIVQALQENGEIVAMTGDGVNDAPALKKANIGIAMGEKGTDVARAAAGMILLDDNFSTIVNAVKEGRRIYNNLRHAFVFLFSFHLPIVGMAILPLFFGHALIFLPIHIIFLELICDPVSVLGFNREQAPRGLMKEPPRRIDEPLIHSDLWKKILIQGLGIFAVCFGLYYYFAVYQNNIGIGRTMAFSSMIISQSLIIIFTREWQQVKTNLLLLIISALTILSLVLIIINPTLRQIFHLSSLILFNWLLMSSVSIFGVISIKGLLLLNKK
jgi:P-type Ca2+ transporter type 2C